MLYLVATPIGNLEDITYRAVKTLGEVDCILAEDTRKTGQLLKHYDIQKKMFSFFEHNEKQKIPQIIDRLLKGEKIALVSSAGMPTISDPGYKLVRQCREQNISVTAVPGPSSVINAVSLSGLPHEKFVFLGYVPRKSSEFKRFLETALTWDLTLVFFDSPHRIIKSLKLLRESCPERPITVAREMTKKFEEIVEGSLDQTIERFSIKPPKGEIVLVVGK
ncbi:MAG: 16S rRNA (cytidine(1402)-2'-O)-methyltransferase [Candidatus Omnitrophica bacterium]|nr:16S rRNA (cytidine(1402)-2'-O)-methyltransferase [Candidatus Omnitrophota bacterium]